MVRPVQRTSIVHDGIFGRIQRICGIADLHQRVRRALAVRHAAGAVQVMCNIGRIWTCRGFEPGHRVGYPQVQPLTPELRHGRGQRLANKVVRKAPGDFLASGGSAEQP